MAVEAMAALVLDGEQSGQSEIPRRRRWVLGPTPHVLPTETGDYVLLTAPRPSAPGSPQLPPMEPIDTSQHSAARANPLFAPSKARLQPLPVQTRPPRTNAADHSDLVLRPAAAHLEARREACRQSSEVPEPRVREPNVSVLRMRRVRAREEAMMAAAVEESKRLAAQPVSAAEEEAALEAAIRASMEPAAVAGSDRVEDRSGEGAAISATHETMRPPLPQSRPQQPPAQRPPQRQLQQQPARSAQQQQHSGAEASADEEEERQLAAAIAASLEEASAAQQTIEADRRYYQQATYMACLDSLRHATTIGAEGGARRAGRPGARDGERPGSRHGPRGGTPSGDSNAAEIGRGIARQILEASAVS